MPTASRNIRQMPDGRYRVRYKLGTRERKKICDSLNAAKKFLEDERKRIFALGRAALSISPGQHARLMVLVDEAAGDKGVAHGIRILEKASKYYEKHKSSDEIPSVADAVEDLIEDWKKCKRNPTYISNGGGILRRFAAAHPNEKIDQIKPRAVHDWINGLNDVDLKTPKARISKLFSHAVLNEWVNTNFVTALRFERKTQTSVEVPIFSEIKSVIESILSSAKYRPLIRPYTRRLYSGIRATEETNPRVRREGRRLLVPAGAAAKKGPARRLAVTRAFLAWDRWCDEQQIPQLTRQELKDLHAAFRKEKGLQGVKKWLNWQRHCYASYRLPLLGNDLTPLAGEMGNSPRVLLDNYVGNVTPADVKLFWAYRPPKKNS